MDFLFFQDKFKSLAIFLGFYEQFFAPIAAKFFSAASAFDFVSFDGFVGSRIFDVFDEQQFRFSESEQPFDDSNGLADVRRLHFANAKETLKDPWTLGQGSGTAAQGCSDPFLMIACANFCKN